MVTIFSTLWRISGIGYRWYVSLLSPFFSLSIFVEFASWLCLCSFRYPKVLWPFSSLLLLFGPLLDLSSSNTRSRCMQLLVSRLFPCNYVLLQLRRQIKISRKIRDSEWWGKREMWLSWIFQAFFFLLSSLFFFFSPGRIQYHKRHLNVHSGASKIVRTRIASIWICWGCFMGFRYCPVYDFFFFVTVLWQKIHIKWRSSIPLNNQTRHAPLHQVSIAINTTVSVVSVLPAYYSSHKVGISACRMDDEKWMAQK